MITNEITLEQVATRNLLVYLKGRIIGYAVRKGMKWESKMEPTAAFQMGYDFGFKKPVNDYPWKQQYYKDEVTALHVIHNRLRHERPHTGSQPMDEVFFERTSQRFDTQLVEDREKLLDMASKEMEVKA